MNKTRNTSALSILISVVIIIVSLFINGLGIYLTIRANIGASPWDVLNLGVSKHLAFEIWLLVRRYGMAGSMC